MGDNKKKKHTGVTAAFWILFALILLIVFLVNRNNILTVLQNTEFFSKVFGSEPEFVINHEPVEKKQPKAELIITEKEAENIKNNTEEIDNNSQETEIKTIDTSKKEEFETQTQIKEQKTEIVNSVQENKQEVAVVPQMEQKLYFIVIDGDGSVLRKESIRQIQKTTTPLTAAIKALLSGPNLTEREKGYMTLIPEGTKLLGASVQGKVATINFSEEFLYNKYGVEGYYGQLMQVVYTASAFSNIESIQFLIDGAKQEYLGSEGVFIGAPLNKGSFK